MLLLSTTYQAVIFSNQFASHSLGKSAMCSYCKWHIKNTTWIQELTCVQLESYDACPRPSGSDSRMEEVRGSENAFPQWIIQHGLDSHTLSLKKKTINKNKKHFTVSMIANHDQVGWRTRKNMCYLPSSSLTASEASLGSSNSTKAKPGGFLATQTLLKGPKYPKADSNSALLPLFPRFPT